MKSKKTSAKKKSSRKKPAATVKTKANTHTNPAPSVALADTISKADRKAEMRYIPWSAVAIEALKPDLGRQLIVGQNIMLARVLLKKGCIVPEHSHPNEQVTYILEGALKFWIDGQEIVVNRGEVLTIPPNMPHKAEALVDTVDLDVFHPPRADWMSGTDSYLR